MRKFYFWLLLNIGVITPDKLDEIVRRRHRVAHTADALSIARSDLREAIKFLKVLSWQLDKRLRSQIKNLRKESAKE